MKRYGPLLIFLVGCTVLNNPYPHAEENENILYSSFSERPKHLDPAQSYSSNEIIYTAQIYEPPFQYHYLKYPYTLVPLTATDIPTPVYLDSQGNILPDSASDAEIAFSLYEIRIKPSILYQPHPALAKDAKGHYRYHALTQNELAGIDSLSDFHETGSRELIADDYVYGIKRLAHPQIHSPIYGFMSDYIVGLTDFGQQLKEKAAQLHEGEFLDLSAFPLSGVEIVDRYTFRLKIHGKYPQMLYWLAMPFFAPLPWEADRFYSQPGLIAKNITLDGYPIGTGPYRLTQNDPNRKIVLVKNPNFHGEPYPHEGEAEDHENSLLVDAGRPMPFIEKAVFVYEKEDIPVWNKFLQGFYDASGITSDQFDQVIQTGVSGKADLTDEIKDKGIRLLTGASPSTYYTGVNMLDPVLGGMSESARKLRRALSIVLDQEEAIAIFNNGRGVAMQGPLPPGIFGYRKGETGINRFVYNVVKGRPQRKSLEEAAGLLAEAGYPHGRNTQSGEPLTLYFDTPGGSADDKAYFDWLRKQFSKLHIQLVIRSTDYNRFQDKMLKGTAQLFQWGWHADYPDPENFLFLLYSANAKVGKNGENATNYTNPEFDRLFDRMRHMPNGEARQGLIDAMVEIVRRDGPWIAGFHPISFELYHAWYENVKLNKMSYNTLKYKKIDRGLRTQQRRAWNQPVLGPLIFVIVLFAGFTIPAIRLYRKREKSPLW